MLAMKFTNTWHHCNLIINSLFWHSLISELFKLYLRNPRRKTKSFKKAVGRCRPFDGLSAKSPKRLIKPLRPFKTGHQTVRGKQQSTALRLDREINPHFHMENSFRFQYTWLHDVQEKPLYKVRFLMHTDRCVGHWDRSWSWISHYKADLSTWFYPNSNI